MMQKPWKIIETLAHGYSSESNRQEISNEYQPTWQSLNWFQKSLRPCALDEISLSIGKVNPYAAGGYFGQYKMMQKSWKMIETLANGYRNFACIRRTFLH